VLGCYFHLEGRKELSYAWGIGETSNNEVEALALWKGFWIMKN
jgi:hypothetical protein